MPRSFHASLLLCVASLCVCNGAPPPNVVLIIGESTDGRLLRSGSPVPLPNVRLLQRAGVWFDTAYSNSPVCAPSRSSLWSGRAPHRIPHEHNGFPVAGVWNNYEGLDAGYANETLDALLSASGYDVLLTGKLDRTVGGHTLTDRLESVTHNVDVPYNISATGGWNCEATLCTDAGTVAPGGSGGPEGSVYRGDWAAVERATAFIRAHNASGGAPWFVFQGTNIVHPPYATNEYWWSQIDPAAVVLPQWVPLADMHPCDVQASMLRGCTPPASADAAFSDPTRLARIIRIHYASLAEWDAMLGAYIAAVRDSGQWERTVWVVGADHGDMHLEHRSVYKMLAFEGSAHVPLLVAGAAVAPAAAGSVVTAPTQLLDIMPTVLTLAGAPPAPSAEGYDLAPFLAGAPTDAARPPFVVSQNADSDAGGAWFMVRHSSAAWGELKMIVWGSGAENPLIVYNLSADPGETTNVARSIGSDVVAALDAALRSVVDYPSVAADIARYSHEQFVYWANSTKDWEDVLGSDALRWAAAYRERPKLARAAFADFYASGFNGSVTGIKPCRGGNAWPPGAAASAAVGGG